MFYPDVSLEEWLEKYPDLYVFGRKCEGCGKTMRTNTPFIMRGYVGLESGDCSCKKNHSRCSVRITTTDKEHTRWVNLIKGVK